MFSALSAPGNADRGPRGRGGGEGVRTRDHLANSRTLLAWLRSAIVLLGIAYVSARLHLVEAWSSQLLTAAIAAGSVVTTILAAMEFFQRRAAVERSFYSPDVVRCLLITAATGLLGVVALAWALLVP
jgi:uncharacterized membrane protein YidH (DUF202 family)